MHAEYDSRPALGRLLILLAALLWSTSGLFVKAPLFADWPAESRGLLLAFWRAACASLVLVPLVRRPQWHWGLLPMSLIFAAMSLTYLSSMTLTTAANAIWLQNTAPFWVLLATLTWFREPLARRDAIPLVCAALGVGLILQQELTRSSLSDARGVLLALVSGIFFAATMLSMRQLRAYDSAWLVAVNHVVAVVLLAPLALSSGHFPTAWQFAVLLAFGGLQMGIPYLLFARGLRHVSSQEGAVIVLLEPVLVPLWTWLAWDERPAWWTLAGGGCILVGLVARYGWPARPPSAEMTRGRAIR